MEIQVIKDQISNDELKRIAQGQFGNLVKAVVDMEQEIMAVGGFLHENEQNWLLEKEGSKRENLWGINLYPQRTGKDFIEFDSIINLRPSFGSKGIHDPKVQERIRNIVEKLVSQREKFSILPHWGKPKK